MDIVNIETEKKDIKISKSQKVNGEIVQFGSDNMYPARIASLIEQSQTASACSSIFAKFIATPFTDSVVGQTIIGYTPTGKVYTMTKLVKEISESLAKYSGAYVLVSKNLAGEVTSAKVVDFTKVRFSSFDDLGRSNFAYIGDWSGEVVNVGKKKNSKFQKIPLYTSIYDVYKRMAENCGTTLSLYHIFANEQYVYPTSIFEAVAYDMATEFEIQVNRYEEITQGSPSKIIIHTDIAGSEAEKEEQIAEIEKFAGSKGSRCLIIRSSFDDSGEPISNGYKLDQISDTRDLAKFNEAEKACANNIRKVIGIQSILIDSENITSVEVSAAQMKMATYLFDLQIKDIRELVTASLSEIFAKTNIDFKSKNFSFTSKNFEEYEKKENI